MIATKYIRVFCDERQIRLLDEIFDKMHFFSKTNANNVTVALERILLELTYPRLVDLSYVKEQLEKISSELGET